MQKETFGQRFLRLRKERGLTQETIAQSVGVSNQAVSKWENDISCPDITLLLQLADLLRVKVETLLGKEDNEVKLVEEEKKKDIDKLVMHINVLSQDGDQVSLNLPLPLVIAGIKLGHNFTFIGGNKALEGIEFGEIITLVEKGLIGEIVSINNSDGDVVKIIVD